MENMELTHHGIKGMKWGVRRSPAQLGHTVAKKKKKQSVGDVVKDGAKKLKKTVHDMKVRHVRKQNAEKAREAKKTKEEYEAEKKKALESGTAADILKFKGKLTNQELSNAVNRLNMESQLAQINARTVKTGMDKAEKFMADVDRVRGMAEKGISAWNTFAKIHNSLSPNDLPTLDGNYKDRKEAAAEKAAKKAEEKLKKKKEKLMKSGTPEDIAKNFGLFDGRDLANIETRFKFQETIKSRIPKTETKPKQETVDNAKKWVDNLINRKPKVAGLFGPGSTENDTPARSQGDVFDAFDSKDIKR